MANLMKQQQQKNLIQHFSYIGQLSELNGDRLRHGTFHTQYRLNWCFILALLFDAFADLNLHLARSFSHCFTASLRKIHNR